MTTIIRRAINPISLRDKLSGLSGDDRLDVSAIKNAGSGSGASGFVVNSYAATVNFDLDNGANQKHSVELTGNATFALTNPATNYPFVLRIAQDSTGSRIVTWFSGITWIDAGSAPTLNTDASSVNLVGFICTGAGAYDGFLMV
jgi:hypothetical protein